MVYSRKTGLGLKKSAGHTQMNALARAVGNELVILGRDEKRAEELRLRCRKRTITPKEREELRKLAALNKGRALRLIERVGVKD